MAIFDFLSKGKTALRVAEILSRDYSLEVSVSSKEMRVVNGVTLDVLKENSNANENDIAAVFLYLIINERWDCLDDDKVSNIADKIKKHMNLGKFSDYDYPELVLHASRSYLM